MLILHNMDVITVLKFVLWINIIVISNCATVSRENPVLVIPLRFSVSSVRLVLSRETKYTTDGQPLVPPLTAESWQQIRNNLTSYFGRGYNKQRFNGARKPHGDATVQGNTGNWQAYNGMHNRPQLAKNAKSTGTGSKHKDRDEATAKIVGGTYPGPYEWPWLVSIQYLGEDLFWHHFCGASLISDLWVITAAHCVQALEEYTLRLALGDYQLTRPSFEEQFVNPKKILMHVRFDNESYYNDIALVKLERRAVINNAVKIIEIISSSEDTFNNNNKCFISGWGNDVGSIGEMFMSDYLRHSRMTIITNDQCKESYGDVIVASQICIESDSASACSGDSGGPFICPVQDKHFKLVGLASYVGSASCDPGSPNVYTRISSFYSWIHDVMHDFS